MIERFTLDSIRDLDGGAIRAAIDRDLEAGGIDQVIVGGESGPGARRMNPQWVRDLREQCRLYGVAFFFKQWGAFAEDGRRVGKKAAGAMLDGREWKEMPA